MFLAIRVSERIAREHGSIEMSPAPLTTIAEIGALAITDQASAGIDATETPEYVEIQHQISRIDLGGVRAVDWQQVIANAVVVVRERSKNLRIGVYLAYGLYETRGLRGLGVGLGVLRDMCDAYWDDLHPPPGRLRGRVLALEWLAERVLAALGRSDAEVDASDLRYAVAQTERLVASLTERSPAAGGALGRLVPIMRSRQAALVREADERRRLAGATATGTASASSSSADPTGASEIRPGDDRTARQTRERSLRALGRTMLDVAHGLRVADVADVRAYTLQRAAIWLPVRKLPPSVAGRTELPPPATERRGAIEAAMAGGDCAGALALCEDAATDSLFWLDVHRIAAEALVCLGHEAAARAIRSEAGALLCRLPALAGMSFDDGTPFAEPATRKWLGLSADSPDRKRSRPTSDAGALSAAQTPGPSGTRA